MEHLELAIFIHRPPAPFHDSEKLDMSGLEGEDYEGYETQLHKKLQSNLQTSRPRKREGRTQVELEQ